MPHQNRKFLWIRGLWLLWAILLGPLLVPGPAVGQDRSNIAPRARVPIFDAGAPVQRKVLKSGLTILVQEQRTSYRVAGAVAVRMGTIYESDDDAGRGQVLIKAILAGTQKITSVELALRLLAAEAQLESGAGPDLGQISISTKREQVDTAIDLLAEVALQPAFPDTAVDGMRQRALTAAADQDENPVRASYSMFLGPMYRGSPLQRSVAGTVSGLAGCRRKDVLALYKKYFVGGNMHHPARRSGAGDDVRVPGAGLHGARLPRLQDH